MSAYRIHVLEMELETLRNGVSGGFNIHPDIKKIQNKKEKIREKNKRILNGFLWWLDKFTVKLQVCSIKERAILMRLYGKEEHTFKKTQEERNLLKEIIYRSSGFV